MTQPESKSAKVVGIQERRLGPTVLRTYRAKFDIDELVPNDRQPRAGSKEDEELQRQIEANDGIFEPLLVEPHPDLPGKFRIIDGERRWTNSRLLVEQGRDQYRKIPVEVTDRTLTDEERLRVWIYIHRQRKEWDAREKEMVAYRLVEFMGRASAASILGISIRELEKLVEVFELSERFVNLRDNGAGISWARELLGVSKKLLTPSVIDAVVDKVNRQRVTNSKDLRKLRSILADPVAKDNFLTRDGDLETASLRLGPGEKRRDPDFVSNLDATVESMKQLPWMALEDMKSDPEILRKIEAAEALLQTLRQTISKNK
ncbi:MAG: ParB N-terminal domain-containing protein [Hyphomicrobium sp.]|jgi:ParB family chromosome partitioning protein|uniref:ParB/RepB/Spo0J family partition protein n=1 Tax=Hyphomicrobium sp. TaxID=82 RepID=UPI0025C42217|nr:ParB N-terminal domain-containing protein [Hyphomicrobium sp.]MBX9865108.1 ParB N-terminal domain-containing protein [Hyphomicrobium sp.]